MRRIIYAGDSTVTFNRIATYPQTGLSQGLLLYVKEDVFVRSFAINGRSTKSFIAQGRLAQVDAYLEEGDVLLIQFGHNDEKQADPLRYADPYGEYTDNLRLFIETARRHGALPVLVTSLARRLFDPQTGRFLPGSHGDYPDAVRRLAAEEQVPCIDLTAASEQYLAAVGDFASRALYVYPADNSHLSVHGAAVYAGFIADGLRALGGTYADLLVARDAEDVDADARASVYPYMEFSSSGQGWEQQKEAIEKSEKE